VDQPKAWQQYALIPPEPDGHFVMIPLTRGKFTIVDEADAEMILGRGKWHVLPRCNTFYAVRSEGSNPRRKVLMHVLIADCERPDHVNRNGLDNRRINLREATPSQNGANRGLPAANTSGYRGVYWNKQRRRWTAIISIAGHKKYLGHFGDPAEAARAYNRAALETWGEFASLNPVSPAA
jgi:AP2 domain